MTMTPISSSSLGMGTSSNGARAAKLWRHRRCGVGEQPAISAPGSWHVSTAVLLADGSARAIPILAARRSGAPEWSLAAAWSRIRLRRCGGFQHGIEHGSSVGELETFSTSEVAVCCSSDSVSSRVRACTSSNSRTFSMAITAWSAKVVTSSICLSVNGRGIVRVPG